MSGGALNPYTQMIFLAIIASYIFGSIPTAYLYGRLFKGIDIRKSGSGNVGATNALRVLGKKAGLVVLLIDISKGIIPVVFISDFIINNNYSGLSEDFIRIVLGISCILGHNWTIFLNFKGGKGVATTFGVIIGLSLRVPGLALIMGLVILGWFSVFLLTRVVSLASILSSISFPVLAVVFKQTKTMVVFAFLVCVFILIRHIPNIKRILQGKESRISFKK